MSIWPYVAAIPTPDLEGHHLLGQWADHIWRGAAGRFEQVLIGTRTRRVYLAVVFDLQQKQIHGHHLLHLDHRYDTDDDTDDPVESAAGRRGDSRLGSWTRLGSGDG